MKRNIRKLKSQTELHELQERLARERESGKPCIAICGGPGCRAYGCEDVYHAFKDEMELLGVSDRIDVKLTGCHGFCECGTLVVIYPEKILYVHITPKDVPEIVTKTLLKKKVIERLLYTDPVSGLKIKHEHDVPFYKKQQRLLFGVNSLIDSTNIEDYLAIGGYQALAKAIFEMKPEEVIEEVKRSGLRARRSRDRVCAAAVAVAFLRAENGNPVEMPLQRMEQDMLSVMPMKVIPVPLWIGACWKEIPTVSLKE
jgi:NADH-quinone oxidoreductase subunit F